MQNKLRVRASGSGFGFRVQGKLRVSELISKGARCRQEEGTPKILKPPNPQFLNPKP